MSENCPKSAVSGGYSSPDLPGSCQENPSKSGCANIEGELEGLAVAIPWGFESPLPHHTSEPPVKPRLFEPRSSSCPPIVHELGSTRYNRACMTDELEMLQRENADLKRVLAAVKAFCRDCPNCQVLSEAIRDTGMSDYDIERLTRRKMPSE